MGDLAQDQQMKLRPFSQFEEVWNQLKMGYLDFKRIIKRAQESDPINQHPNCVSQPCQIVAGLFYVYFFVKFSGKCLKHGKLKNRIKFFGEREEICLQNHVY